MSQSLAHVCFAPFVALVVCGLALAAILRASHLKPDWSRLSQVAQDEQGGVQSLAFVLTFPVFLLLFLFIVQLSQLLIAVGVVQYASFAAARAASVWIPADIDDAYRSSGGDFDSQNELPPLIAPGQPWVLDRSVIESLSSRKCREIWTAAVLGCTSICPSSGKGASGAPSALAGSLSGSLLLVVQALDPTSRANARMPARIASKVLYGVDNTSVELKFQDRTNQGANGEIATYNPLSHPTAPYLASEVGWQDAVAVTVRHKFALMPGPGRWLAAAIANGDGRILREGGVYKTTLVGTTTMSIEGLQSLRPTLHPPQ